MNKRHKDIEQLFREGLHDHAQPPSSRAWKKLEKELGHEKKVLPLYWRAVAILLLAVGIAVAGWFILEQPALYNAARQKGQKEMLPKTRFTVPDPAVASGATGSDESGSSEETGNDISPVPRKPVNLPVANQEATADLQLPDSKWNNQPVREKISPLSPRQPTLAQGAVPELDNKLRPGDRGITVQFKPGILARTNEREKQRNVLFNQVNNLISDISLGEIRDAKNELIAGLLNPKKGNRKTSD